MLKQEYEREPTAEEIAKVLELDLSDVSDMFSMARRAVSMDSPMQKHSDNRLIDVIENQQDSEPDAEVMDEALKEEVDEIGVQFKLTRERVRRY